MIGVDIMTDNEMLLAMSSLLQPIKTDIQEMKNEIKEMNDRIEIIEVMQEKEILPRLKKVEIIQENEILPQLQLIESCYVSSSEKFKNSVEDVETMQQDISILKQIVTKHSEKLQKIS